MPSPTNVIGLEQRASEIRAQRGETVAVDEIASVVTALVKGTTHDDEMGKVAEELRGLLQYISAAKGELVGMQPKSLSSRDIPDAGIELDAVVKTTEQAASTIMDVADTLGTIAESVDADTAARLNDAATELFHASSFQDITGQRITKVNTTLAHLEERLSALAAAIGDDFVAEVGKDIELDTDGIAVNDTDLLHGPQLEGDGNSQAEIDAILASFD